MRVANYQPQLVWKLRNELRKLGVIQDDDEYIKNFYHPRSFVGPHTQYIHDRTGSIRHFLPMTQHCRPWPKWNNKLEVLDRQQGFELLIKQRARQILNMDKKINVWWSGGLDSTLIALTLIFLATDKKQIRVIGTPDSVVESGPIFDDFIMYSGCDWLIASRIRRDLFLKQSKIDVPNELFVDGHTADQLYGRQTIFAPQWRPDLLDEPWEDAIMQLELEDPKKVIDFTMPAVRATPYQNLKRYRDFLWWYKHNFTMHQHTYASYGLSLNSGNNIRFFDDEGLHEWAQVYGPDMIEEWPDKMPQRLWLYALTKNSEYSFLKRRYRSTGTTFLIKQPLTLVDHTPVWESQIVEAVAKLG